MMYNIINGFVINRKNFLEYDKISTIYSLQLGKIKVLFKGVNKITAKFISFLEPATEVELQIVKLKNKNYEPIFKFAGGRAVNFNDKLRENFKIYEYTCKILDIVDALTFEYVKDDNKFFLIKRMFDFLAYSKNIEIVFLAFVWRFIKLCGYMPELNKCVKCKNNFDNKFYFFNFVDKGIMCNECAKTSESENLEKLRISLSTKELLKKFYRLNAEEIDNLKVAKETVNEISKFIFLYLQSYLHRPLKVYF
ncbi:MAG: DNA repair protein RecO [Endomicrobiia bacterium]